VVTTNAGTAIAIVEISGRFRTFIMNHEPNKGVNALAMTTPIISRMVIPVALALSIDSFGLFITSFVPFRKCRVVEGRTASGVHWALVLGFAMFGAISQFLTYRFLPVGEVFRWSRRVPAIPSAVWRPVRRVADVDSPG